MDTIDSDRRSENMRRIKSGNTCPEMVVRQLLYRLGYRYRLHWSKLPGKPDIVLTRARKAIFVHGCFWHQHEFCRHGRLPKSRLDYWAPKLARNRARDEQIQRELRALGWDVLVIWECEVADAERLERCLSRFVGCPRRQNVTRSACPLATLEDGLGASS